ncbi:MAG: hypothetical protein JOZ22_00300 [Acidobacteriia bacterium]|nr:hypothetical protein [Terriglobia bacterium]
MIAFAGIEVLLSLNNAFAIPPLPAVRYGAWRIIDSRFPLNVPDWFDDDAPVDRRKYPNAEVEWRIAADAGTRFPRGHMAEARLVQITVTVNFDYFAYLSALRHHPVHYWPWSVDGSTQGANAPDYIVDAPGFDKLYPGAGNATYYPSVASDVALGKIPYIELFRFPGPGTARMVVYVKK